MKLAVIPARGGSKRIPRKNIKEFCGRPMLSWSIQAAQRSGCFDRIVVSTDDDEIAKVARACGAETPFVRPPELSNDFVGTGPVVAHASQLIADSGDVPEQVCCIYATAPFLVAEDLQQGLSSLLETGADYAFSVTSYGFPIQRALRRSATGRLEMIQPEHLYTRSQDLEEAFHDAGQFYWGTFDAWQRGIPIFSSASCPVFLPRWRVQDIDTAEDWTRAELMFKASELAVAKVGT